MIFPNPLRGFVAVLQVLWYRMRGYEILADPATALARRETCYDCEFHYDGQCQICTCHIGAKTVLLPEQCPRKKWLRVKRKKTLTRRA